MKRMSIRAMLVTALFTMAGCYVSEPTPQYAGEEDGSGDLVEVSPGVEVVADYGEPIFFADNYYWAYRGGIWYSSPWYRGGWARTERVSPRVLGIPHPETYAHYRPTGYVAHEQIRGGYASHAQFHAAHPASGGLRIRAAVRGGRR